MILTRKSIRKLSAAVIIRAAQDISGGCKLVQKQAIRDVENGALDLFLQILGLSISKSDFIKMSQREPIRKRKLSESEELRKCLELE